jgi:hypothetical protein
MCVACIDTDEFTFDDQSVIVRIEASRDDVTDEQYEQLLQAAMGAES